MSAVVTLVGEGLLADFVCDELATGDCQVVRRNGWESSRQMRADLALVLDDGWNPVAHSKAEEQFQSEGIPWLRGFASFGEGIIGPLVRPGVPGCSQCADIRLLLAGRERKEMWGLQQQLEEKARMDAGLQELAPHDVWASRTALYQMARLIAEETRSILEGKPSRLQERIFLLNLKTLKSSLHFFQPNPLCPICSQIPDDSAEAAVISLQSSPKAAPDSFRCRPIKELKQFLVKDYLDARSGFLNGIMHDLDSPFADVVVNLPMFTSDEITAGRTSSYAYSELTAILEGLERYCGMAPRGKRTVVRDSYRNLETAALDPARIGLHAKKQYDRPDFPFEAYHPDRPLDWVWGYSFMQERPILVPERIAYYGLRNEDGFVYETSNGCALGGSLEEAIFYGIMEVVERDSFLMTWYAELPLPRLDAGSAGDRELTLMIERLRTVAGYEIHLFNSTMENRIPSVWAIAKNKKKTGINLICAAGAHLDPLRAVKSAIYELAGMMLSMDDKFEADRDQYEQMLRDPFLVKQMDDHSMLYGLPEAEERLRFLLNDNRPLRTFEEEYPISKRTKSNPDLTDDLKSVLREFRRLNLEVIVVNQTVPELKQNGLHCVKVLIPGMLPMTFGYHLSRLEGLDRVLRIPAELGFAAKPLTPDELNPHPHPFP